MAADQERDFVAEAAALILSARAGSLATTDAGAPHVALVTPAPAGDGGLLLLLSTLSAHTRHLAAEPACALLLVGPGTSPNPQTSPRVTLRAVAAVSTAPEDRAAYLRHHPYAEPYSGFADFNIWRLRLTAAHYVGGFAAASALNLLALQHEIIAAAQRNGG